MRKRLIALVPLACLLLGACSFSHTDTGRFTVENSEVQPVTSAVEHVDTAKSLTMLYSIKTPGIDADVSGAVLDGLDPFMSITRGEEQYDWEELTDADLSDLADAFASFELTNAYPPDDVSEVTSSLREKLPLVFGGRTPYLTTVHIMTKDGWNDSVVRIFGDPHLFLGNEFPSPEKADFTGRLKNTVVYISEYDCVAIFNRSSEPTQTRFLYYYVNASQTSGGELKVSAVRLEESTMTAVNSGAFDVHSKSFEERQGIIAGLINNAYDAARLTQATLPVVKASFVTVRGELKLSRIVNVFGVLELTDPTVPLVTTQSVEITSAEESSTEE